MTSINCRCEIIKMVLVSLERYYSGQGLSKQDSKLSREESIVPACKRDNAIPVNVHQHLLWTPFWRAGYSTRKEKRGLLQISKVCKAVRKQLQNYLYSRFPFIYNETTPMLCYLHTCKWKQEPLKAHTISLSKQLKVERTLLRCKTKKGWERGWDTNINCELQLNKYIIKKTGGP